MLLLLFGFVFLIQSLLLLSDDVCLWLLFISSISLILIVIFLC